MISENRTGMKQSDSGSPGNSRLRVEASPEGVLLVTLSGSWTVDCTLPAPESFLVGVTTSPPPLLVTFDASGLTRWDSSLLTFLLKVLAGSASAGVAVDRAGLPHGVRRLLALTTAVPERTGTTRDIHRPPFLIRVADTAISVWNSNREMLEFIGEATLSALRLCGGKARFRRSDLLLIIQDCGVGSLPIVSLISLLVGLILAFVGAIQLQMFGAQIYVANLVGIGMVREMGAIMTGIIVTGRTGASFAAQLGTMQVNEEIDALQTLGISPMEYLVLPRMLALCLMMPLLCLYADLMGVLGGFVVGVLMLDITPTQYYLQSCGAVHLNDLFIGVFMSAVFGILVALTGCMRGIQCGRSASAVGAATTSAVVSGIVSIIVATALITIICNFLGI
jgi:phospholipid/cholesterol/gamma-HCH transport system permease protein